jgi:hypothetical protein
MLLFLTVAGAGDGSLESNTAAIITLRRAVVRELDHPRIECANAQMIARWEIPL